jgi:hypothetical protein
MDRSTERLAGQQPVERFKPTTGAFVGWSGLVVALGTVVYVVVQEHSVLGVRLATAGLFAAVVIWVTQLRPRVTAYDDALLMHGTVSDTRIPYVLVDEVSMAQTLNVWVGRKRYVCVGIGRSVGFEMRQRVRSQSGNTLFGSRAYTFTGRPEIGGTERRTSYQSFVLDRITDLVAAAKRRPPPEHAPQVTHRYAVPEVAGLVVTGLLFVASLLLL